MTSRPGSSGETWWWRSCRPRGASGAPSCAAATTCSFILLDSLRADHLGLDEGAVVATPNLARLASKGVVFEAARASSSWTRPSVVSMFTSRPPWSHGTDTTYAKLPRGISYLPELLQRSGYRTEAAVATAMVSHVFGMERGYDRTHDLWGRAQTTIPHQPLARGAMISNALLAPAFGSPRPLFFYLHEIDPHSPYKPIQRFSEPYVGDYEGRRLHG